jgi:translation initiation factor 2B subunit (eIF-2B alpha/beta/delta family)
MANLTKNAKKKYKERVEFLKKNTVQVNPVSGPKIIPEASAVFTALYEQKDFFAIDDLKNEAFARYQNSSEFIETVQKILSDEELAKKWFGTKQAEARVLGIQFLGYLAEHVSEHFLQATVENLIHNLNKTKKQVSSSQLLDLEDLVTQLSYNRRDKSELKDLIKECSEEFGIVDADKNAEKQKILTQSFVKGLALGLRSAHKWEHINNVITEQFPLSF